MTPDFLTLDDVLEMHEQQIERYGGSRGLRDRGGLESALAVPQAPFGRGYLHQTTSAMAADYLFHLAQNHAFIDGNKRVGTHAAITFLPLNGGQPVFDEEQLVELVLGVASGTIGNAEVTDFVTRFSRAGEP